MNPRLGSYRWMPSAPTQAGLVGLIVVLLPPLLYGPWVPLLDLVAFVGMDNFPAGHSYGPLHYAVFQFTYIVHYALSRGMQALSMAAPTQVLLLYLLQATVLYVVTWRLLQRLISETWLCCVAISLGTLAFWDGFFLWGGPLPFSLAATCFAGAAFFVVREADDPRDANPLATPLLLWLAVMCHPFALPFAAILTVLRGVFVPARRAHSAGLLCSLAVLGWIIMKDSPEQAASAGLRNLVTWPWHALPERIGHLFMTDAGFVRQLFGDCPAGLEFYFMVKGLIHLLGFLTAPIVMFVARELRGLRFLATLTTAVVVLHCCAPETVTVIPGWPWRILTFHQPFTFVAGFAGPLYLVRRWRPATPKPVAIRPLFFWAAPAATMALLLVAQSPILRHSASIARNLEQARSELLQSGVRNALLVAANVDAIEPFYLRSIPFLLFSDPALVERNLLLYTEWHIQDRHPSRLTESWFDLGRPMYQAVFSAPNGSLHVKIVPQAPGRFPLSAGNNQTAQGGKPDLPALQFQQATRLLQLGCLRDAIFHYQTALAAAPEFAEAHNNLGVAYLSSQRLSDAISHLRLATQLRSGYVDAHANLGSALLDAGKIDEAREQFQTALRLDPGNVHARQGLRGIAAP